MKRTKSPAVRKLFGTDGIRGVANIEPITSEVALRLGRAAAHVFKTRPGRHRIVIGKDTRLSGYMIESALTSGICSMGVDVLLVGNGDSAIDGQGRVIAAAVGCPATPLVRPTPGRIRNSVCPGMCLWNLGYRVDPFNYVCQLSCQIGVRCTLPLLNTNGLIDGIFIPTAWLGHRAVCFH